MITVYYKKSCTSSKKAIKWLDNHNIKYNKCIISKISQKDLIHVLSLTDNGLESIVKTQGQSKIKKKIASLYELTFNGALDYLKSNSEILRTPIIFSDKKLLIGYHDVEIRQFISKKLKYYDNNLRFD